MYSMKDHRTSKRLALLGSGAAIAVSWAIQHNKVSCARNLPASNRPIMPDDVTHHTISTDDGAKIHVVERGKGRPIVLLHGVTLSADIWALQMRELSEDFRVIALDQRGHGLSVPGTERFGKETYEIKNKESSIGSPVTYRMAMDLKSVLEELDLRDVILVGHSMGGMVAMEYSVNLASNTPDEKVSALALTSTAADQLVRIPGIEGASEPLMVGVDSLLKTASRRKDHFIPKGDLSYWTTRLAFGKSPDPAHVCLTEDIIRAVAPAWVTEILSSLVKFNISSQLHTIKMPTSVLVGSSDVLTPPWYARRIAARITNSELYVIPGCGHMSMLERPADLAKMLQALAKRSPSYTL